MPTGGASLDEDAIRIHIPFVGVLDDQRECVRYLRNSGVQDVSFDVVRHRRRPENEGVETLCEESEGDRLGLAAREELVPATRADDHRGYWR